MSINTEEPIKSIFDLLDQWRGLPNYQMERRVDIYFALYLHEIIMAYFKDELKGEKITHVNIIPEFPLKKDGNRQSLKVDYAVFSKNKLFLVELKTDVNSLNDVQYGNLIIAKSKSLYDFVSIIPDIAIGSDQRKKYMYLIKCIKELLSLVYEINIESETNVCDDSKKALDCLCEEFKAKESQFSERRVDVEIVYILPENADNDDKVKKYGIGEDAHIITFEKIRSYISALSNLDAYGKRFVESLERWKKEPHSPM